MENMVNVQVEGMTCGNCALTISKYLEKKGMKDVVANAALGAVSFVATENTDLDKIYAGIESLGYAVKTEEAHDHEHNHNHGGLEKYLIVCALFTAPLLLHMFVGEHSILNNPWVQFILCLPVYGIGVWKFGVSAFRSLRNGIPNMDVLIIMGASAAFIYSLMGVFMYADGAHHYLFFETAATIITFVLLGNWIEEKTVTTTTSSIKALAALQPNKAKLLQIDSIGKEMIMEVERKYLKIDDVIVLNDGDSIPADGVIIQGEATINESMLSGESEPVVKVIGDNVTGGAVLIQGNLRMKATAVGKATALSEIIKMVQQAQAAKPPMQKLADKISAIFVPLVLIIAVITFLANYFIADIDLASSMMRSIAVLVIACPCAMGLATPAAVAVGLGRAARLGILIKGGDTLEQFKNIKHIVFDKTGTLTTGDLQIKDFTVSGMDENLFKQAVVSLEQYSSHPIAKSILKNWSGVKPLGMNNVTETKGKGLVGTDEHGFEWEIGSFKILNNIATAHQAWDLHVMRNKIWVGGIAIADELRPDAKETIQVLHKDGFDTIMLSGDRKQKAEAIGESLGIDVVLYEQSPAQKMEQLNTWQQKGAIAMVGDGINDAPALAKADIGISLSDATQVAIQSANVILTNNKLSQLPKAIRLGKLTYQTIKQNLFWAFIYNVLAIPLAAMGYLSPIWAAVVMAFSDVILVLNSIRLNYRNID